MIKIFFIIIVLVITLNNADLFAGGSAGTTAGDILLVVPSASVNASGNSGVALREAGPQYISLNPAYISETNKKSIGFTFNKHFESTNQQEVMYCSKIKNRMFSLNISYFDYGSMPRTLYNQQTGDYTISGDYSASDYILKSYISSPEILGCQTGIGVKYLKNKIENETANALMFDLGALYHSKYKPVSVGVTLQNIGSKIKCLTQKHDLPLLFKAGVSCNLLEDKLVVSLDWQKINKNDADFLLGTLYRFNKNFSLRSGYDNSNDASKNITFGFDVFIRDTIELSYAYVPYNDFSSSHKLSFVYYFGNLINKDRSIK